jgi:hypothetical protein
VGSIDYLMIHTCHILIDTGTTQNAAGEPITNFVSTTSVCFFSNVSTAGNSVSDSEAGKVILSSIVAFLPDSVTVESGDFISTTEENWIGTYEVQKVDAPEIPYTGIVDHKEAYLKRVAKRG